MEKSSDTEDYDSQADTGPIGVRDGVGARSARDKAVALGSHIGELEHMAASFKLKVEDIAREFEMLRDELDECVLKIDALETDHSTVLDAYEEEKVTASTYYGWLRNAEVEVEVLRRAVPPDSAEAGFCSQAKPY